MGGYVRTPEQAVPIELKSDVKLSIDGLVLSIDSTGKGVLTTGAAQPYAVALSDTLNSQKFGLTGDKSYDAGGTVGGAKNGQVRIALAPAAVRDDIDFGSELIVDATTANAGKVRNYKASDAPNTSAGIMARSRIVGTAAEKIAGNNATATHILANVRL